MLIRLCFLSYLWCYQAFGIVAKQDHWALDFHMDYIGIPVEQIESLHPFLIRALDVVDQFPPHEQRLFRWDGDGAVLVGKKYHLLLADSRKAEELSVFANAIKQNKPYASLREWTANGESRLTQVIFLDRVLYDKNYRLRLYHFANYIMALAALINGEAQEYLHDTRPHPERRDARLLLIAGEKMKTALHHFLVRVIHDPRFAAWDKESREAFVVAEKGMHPQPVKAKSCQHVLPHGKKRQHSHRHH